MLLLVWGNNADKSQQAVKSVFLFPFLHHSVSASLISSVPSFFFSASLSLGPVGLQHQYHAGLEVCQVWEICIGWAKINPSAVKL